MSNLNFRVLALLFLLQSPLIAQEEMAHELFHQKINLCENDNIQECIPVYAESFLGTPYVASTLDKEMGERLVVNLGELDCTTFVEYVLALAITGYQHTSEFDFFAKNLENIRYRNGQIEGYASRLHYFSDWLYDNEEKKILQNLTKELGGIPINKEIHFMSQHPKAYKQLANEENIGLIQKAEENLNSREQFYIPQAQIKAVEGKLQDGDIIAITTNIEGLDVAHVGFVKLVKGRAHLLHASSELKKVVVSDEPIADYIAKHKKQTGIMVARVTAQQ